MRETRSWVLRGLSAPREAGNEQIIERRVTVAIRALEKVKRGGGRVSDPGVQEGHSGG